MTPHSLDRKPVIGCTDSGTWVLSDPPTDTNGQGDQGGGRYGLGGDRGVRRSMAVHRRLTCGPDAKLIRRPSVSSSWFKEHDKGLLVLDQRLTVGRWLDHWVESILPTRVFNGALAQSTFGNYADTVRLHLKPHLGQIRSLD